MPRLGGGEGDRTPFLYYSALKRNADLLQNLEDIMQSEISQSQKENIGPDRVAQLVGRVIPHTKRSLV